MIDVNTEPLVTRSPHGSVMVRVSEDAVLRFRNTNLYNAWRESLDREQVLHDTDAILAFEAERDAYHDRMQALAAEREYLAQRKHLWSTG